MPASNARKIVVLISRFPKASETFIEREFMGLAQAGLDFQILPLRAKAGRSLQRDAQALESRVVRISDFSPRILLAHLRFLFTRPLRYLRAWASISRCHPGRPRDAVNFISRFIKSVYFADYCLREGVEHVHAHWANYPTTSAWMVHQLTGLPYSFTGHAYDIYVHQAFLAEKIRDAEFVITCTEYNKRFLNQLCATTPIHVVRHGLPLERYVPAEQKPAGYRILSPARLTRKKGLPYLIRACASLAAKGIVFECRILGDGPLRAELEQLTQELGLGDRIKFPGFVNQSEVIEELKWASMVVIPSIEDTQSGDRDGVPNALIEAQAMAVPVVSTRVSAIPELVEDGVNGLLVEQHDPDALAAAMEKVGASASYAEELGRAGRKKVVAMFDLLESSKIMTDLFNADKP